MIRVKIEVVRVMIEVFRVKIEMVMVEGWLELRLGVVRVRDMCIKMEEIILYSLGMG